MKKLFLTCALSLGLALQSCTAFKYDADDHTGFREEIQPTAYRPDVTFSLVFDDKDSDGFLKEGAAVAGIENEMKASNMFNNVKYVAPSYRGPLHYEYTARLTAPSYIRSFLLGCVGGFTFMTVPVWISYEVDWTLTVYKNGKEIYNDKSEQEMSVIYWLPAPLSWPWAITQDGDMVTRGVNYFLKDLQQKGLHK